MSKILVIAPHPDDETLGCGGTLIRHKSSGDQLYWLIITGIDKNHGWSQDKISIRDREIKQVSKIYGFTKIHNLGLPTAGLDKISTSDLVEQVGNVINQINPSILYVPFIGDAHTDHQKVVQVVNSCIKWYRYPSVMKVLSYETISETDFNFSTNIIFKPNVFVDISKYIDQKIDIMKIYKGEIGEHPFPRNINNIRALAVIRGSQSGFNEAEAFQLLLERK